MADLRSIEQTLMQTAGLEKRPVAVSFRNSEPEAVERYEGSQPSGCSFWRLAAQGRTFYTVPSDHYNCPIGSHTHGIPLPEDRAGELSATLGLMEQIGYLRMEEVPGIPTLSGTPAAIVYAPLGDSPGNPDVVIVAGRPAGVMRLEEAIQRAQVNGAPPLLGRPTCMGLPAALQSGAVLSSGCIGNRVYTSVGDDELYLMVRGSDLEAVAAECGTIASANEQLLRYHVDRKGRLGSE